MRRDTKTPENHESACTIGPSVDGVLAVDVSRLRSPQGLPGGFPPRISYTHGKNSLSTGLTKSSKRVSKMVSAVSVRGASTP